MGKQLFASHPLIRGSVLLTLPLMLMFLIMIFSANSPSAQCTGRCQACYCEDVQNGVCIVNGQPSSCVGCVGSCSGNPPNAECKATPGLGGCGSHIIWDRDSDCNATPPKPAPTATPTPKPPASCKITTWVKVERPKASRIDYEPPYPLVARQDTTNTGFTLHFDVSGGWAKKYEQRPEQMCKTRGQTYPDDCPNDWRWVCVREVVERYDDPIVEVVLGMRLGDGVKEWIENDLGSRYYGATTQDDLPKLWILFHGQTMHWTDDFEYHPFDPGTHGGRLMVKTKGTPLNPPQDVSFPYSVPVYLWDTTLGD